MEATKLVEAGERLVQIDFDPGPSPDKVFQVVAEDLVGVPGPQADVGLGLPTD